MRTETGPYGRAIPRRGADSDIAVHGRAAGFLQPFTMQLVHVTFLAAVLSLQACGGGSGGGSDDSATSVHAPRYGNARSHPRQRADLTPDTGRVMANIGSGQVSLIARFGKTLESMQ